MLGTPGYKPFSLCLTLTPFLLVQIQYPSADPGFHQLVPEISGSLSGPTEREVSVRRHPGPFALEEAEFRQPAVLVLQVWDYDRISANDFLGTAELSSHLHPSSHFCPHCPALGEGERVMALESREGTRAMRRVEEDSRALLASFWALLPPANIHSGL